jgi:protein TonB
MKYVWQIKRSFVRLALGKRITARRDRWVSFSIALLIHFGMLLNTNRFVQPAQFRVEVGENSVEVNLIAAAPIPVMEKNALDQEIVAPAIAESAVEETPEREEIEMAQTESVLPPLQEESVMKEVPELEKEEVLPVDSMPEENIIKNEEPPVEKNESALNQTLAISDASGDGSSEIPGKDPTTLQSSEGALTKAKPSYLRNPPPRYPEISRRLGEEGVVLLFVVVDREGSAVEVRVDKGSGHSLLDEAAVKAVKRWKFEPARLGPLPVESKVRIPVRFQLSK